VCKGDSKAVKQTQDMDAHRLENNGFKLVVHPSQAEDLEREFGKEYVEKNFIINRLLPIK
jgi:hypothetical protein